jgi:hypothetical protein
LSQVASASTLLVTLGSIAGTAYEFGCFVSFERVAALEVLPPLREW